jgi:hypothetical protein
MSDFFYELAAKNLGTANVIMPRRPALFESTTEHPHFQSFNEADSMSNFDDANVVDTSPARRLRRRSETPERIVLESRDIDPPPSPGSRRTFRDAEIEPSSRNISPTSETDTRNRDLNRSHPRLVPGESAKPVDPPKAQPSIVEVKSFPISVSARSTASERRGPERNNQTVEPKTHIIAKPHVAISRDKDVERPRASANIAARFPGERAEKSETPVINITFGRVEVKALPSPTPTRAVKTQPPTVSLDEYLQRRRNGGAR